MRLSGHADFLPRGWLFQRGQLARAIAQGGGWVNGCLSRLVREPRAAVDYPGLSGAVAVGSARLRDDHSGDGPSQCGNGNPARAGASVVSGGLSAGGSYYAAKPEIVPRVFPQSQWIPRGCDGGHWPVAGRRNETEMAAYRRLSVSARRHLAGCAAIGSGAGTSRGLRKDQRRETF